jgi:hypothetical protein
VSPTVGWLSAILLGGLALRLAHFVAVVRTPWPELPLVFDQSDMHAFWKWAEAILAGDWLGRDPYHPYFTWMKEIAPLEVWYRWWGGRVIFQGAPLYPYWLAALLALSTKSLWFVTLVQLLVGALQPLVMFCLARRVFDSRAGLVAAVLTALYGPFIFHQSALLRDWLPPLLEPLAVVALLRGQGTNRPRDWTLAGAALGLAVIAKETFLLFVAMALAWVIVIHRSALRQAAASAVAVLAGLLLVLSPLIVRNVTVGAPAFAVSNRAAENIIEGNAADASPIGLVHPDSMKAILERSGGRPVAVVLETLRGYDGDWRRFIGLQWTKLRALADPLEVPNNLDFRYGVEMSSPLRFTLRYGLIFPLGVAGFLLSLKRWRTHVLLALYGLSTLGALMGTIVLARYRLTLVPALIVYAAFGAVWLFDAVRARAAASAIGYVGLIAAVGALHHLVLPIPSLRDDAAIAIHSPEYLFVAQMYAKRGQFDRAAAEMERLEARARERPLFARTARGASLNQANYRMLWAMQLIEGGQREEARSQLERAAGAYGAFPNLSVALYHLGHSYQRLGDRTKARSFFQRFLAVEPQGPLADAARMALDQLER